MVDPAILKKFGSDHEAIKKLFTCEEPDNALFDYKRQFQKRINSRLINGWTFSLQNSHLYSASDLAWDAAPITRENIPLLLYAQKKIKIDRCSEELDSLGCGEHFVRRNPDNNEIVGIDLPKLFETPVNLLRSYLTRRVAPQATKYNSMFPFFKYEPRATDLVGKLRADATSQRIEEMTDSYGYRHTQTQIIRDMLLYAHATIFPACAWDRELQWVNTPTVGDETTLESKVVREGVDFVKPHPSRVFWDMMYPLSSINTNTGAEYIGYWDLRKYSDILSNPHYFNRNKIKMSTNGRDFYQQYRLYFDSQFNAQRIRFMSLSDLKSRDPVAGNDTKVIAPFYQGCDSDEALFFTEYYERCIPAENGLGTYPHPVWIRLVVASDDTVIFGEFLPTSTPAIYFGYNENDSRALNISMAHEIMPFQDQVTNLLGQLLLSAKANALKIVTMDTDMIDDKVREAVKKTMTGDKYYVDPIVIEYSGIKVKMVGANAQDPVKMIERSASDDITTYFKAITSVLSIIERMLVLSPQELGQPAERLITATESSAISSSTTTVYSFISQAIDEGRAAWKKFIYEALVTKATAPIKVPVIDRYSQETIAAAGFTSIPVVGGGGMQVAQQMVTGSKDKLIHDYTFTSRDGSDRPNSQAAATALTQLLSQIVNVPGILQAMGKKKLYDMINEIFRQSGAGFDLNLEVKDGESDQMGPTQEQQMQQAIQQIGQGLQKQGTQLQQLDQQTQVTDQQLQQVLAALLPKAQGQGGPPTMPGQTQPGVMGPGGPPPSGPPMPMHAPLALQGRTMPGR